MSLYVDRSPGADNPTQDIFTVSWNDGALSQGANSTITGSLGAVKTIPVTKVEYPNVTTGKASADRLHELVNTSSGLNWASPIIITSLSGGTDPYSGDSILGDGVTYLDLGVTPHIVHVVYDSSQNGGQGINVYGTVMGMTHQPITTPNGVILYHELSHAYHYVINQYPFPQNQCPGNTTDEPAAEIDENVLRNQLGLCPRDVCNHDLAPPGPASDCGGSATPGGSPGGTSGGSGGGGGGGSICFIVTAATGAAEAAEIVRLRAIRDEIAARSSIAEALIAAVYDEYFQFSPALARQIAPDPAARLAVRRAVIAPLFAWYSLAHALALPGRDDDLRSHAEALRGACPQELAPAVLGFLAAVDAGTPLANDAPEQLRTLSPALRQASAMPLARWAILEPLVRAWSLDRDGAEAVVGVIGWLADAPVEALAAPSGARAGEREIAALARLLDFAPDARRRIGSRLAQAWPRSRSVLAHNAFI